MTKPADSVPRLARMGGGSPIRLAVITGGHSYDVPNFQILFRQLEGIDTYIQHMDDFATSPQEVRDGYEAVLFYVMLTDTPVDEGLPWHVGQPKSALEHLGQTKQGIFVLHHAILAYPEWPVWDDIVGIKKRTFGFYPEQQLKIDITKSDHSITQGLSSWKMIDETYTMTDAGEGSEVILTTEHSKCMKTIGWTRQHKQSRVFCFQSGHDNTTWSDKNFQETLKRGIFWCAGRV